MKMRMSFISLSMIFRNKRNLTGFDQVQQQSYEEDAELKEHQEQDHRKEYDDADDS